MKKSLWFCLTDLQKIEQSGKKGMDECHGFMENVAREISKIDGVPELKWVNFDGPENLKRNAGYFEIE